MIQSCLTPVMLGPGIKGEKRADEQPEEQFAIARGEGDKELVDDGKGEKEMQIDREASEINRVFEVVGRQPDQGRRSTPPNMHAGTFPRNLPGRLTNPLLSPRECCRQLFWAMRQGCLVATVLDKDLLINGSV